MLGGRQSTRRRAALVLAASVSLVVALFTLTAIRQFFDTTRAAPSWGDGAVLELYTLHASRDTWPLGPYSRFGWHHPGPLLFYALAPLYEFAGFHTFALNAGALAINLASLIVMAWAAVRWAGVATGCAVLAALAVYLWRVGDIALSYWNPLVVVLPFGAFVLVCAGLASGRPAALPGIALIGSFVSQTHVSLLPSVAVLACASMAGLLVGRPVRSEAAARSTGWWIAVSICVLAASWWLPVAEELSQRPGNLSRLARFFSEPDPGQPWMTAALAWGESISAVFRGAFAIPVGEEVRLTNGLVWVALAAVQLLALTAAGWEAHRRGDRFHLCLCLVGAAASVVAFGSITRVRAFIGDYMVFWISIVGALNWAAVGGTALARLSRISALEPLSGRRPMTAVLATVVVLGFLAAEIEQFRRTTHVSPEPVARSVAVLAAGLETHVRREGLQRPLVRFAPAVWSEAAGVIVQLYKQSLPLAIEADMVRYFGQRLAPTGDEDAVIDIADAAQHEQLMKRPGDRLIVSDGPVYIHVNATKPGRPRPGGAGMPR